MLVLTRKQSQMIQIGDNIVVKVIQTGKGSVKIGIDAPGDVRIIRGEILLGDNASNESGLLPVDAEKAKAKAEPDNKPVKPARGPLTRSVA